MVPPLEHEDVILDGEYRTLRHAPDVLPGRARLQDARISRGGYHDDVLADDERALERTLVISQDVIVIPTSGYPRVLKAGSTWKYVGRVPQGSVFAIKDDVFMLEGRHHHEAQCVISNDQRVVGFYLPVEKAFASIQQPVQLPLKRP